MKEEIKLNYCDRFKNEVIDRLDNIIIMLAYLCDKDCYNKNVNYDLEDEC